jgi:hypothetical protein
MELRSAHPLMVATRIRIPLGLLGSIAGQVAISVAALHVETVAVRPPCALIATLSPIAHRSLPHMACLPPDVTQERRWTPS